MDSFQLAVSFLCRFRVFAVAVIIKALSRFNAILARVKVLPDQGRNFMRVIQNNLKDIFMHGASLLQTFTALIDKRILAQSSLPRKNSSIQTFLRCMLLFIFKKSL